jgi:hypothetical protein
LGELTVNYKVNSHLFFGLGTMNNLSNGNRGYYNAEGLFISLCNDDDQDVADADGPDGPNDENGLNDPDGPNGPNDENEDCDEDGLFGKNLMGIITFKFSEKIPFFVQTAGGYSFSGNAPAYSAMIGYNQKIFAGLGIIGGVRFSDVLYKKPADAVKVTPSAGFKAELGLSWNF